MKKPWVYLYFILCTILLPFGCIIDYWNGYSMPSWKEFKNYMWIMTRFWAKFGHKSERSLDRTKLLLKL